jgi:hypothetical protein
MNRFQELVRTRLRIKTPNFSTLAAFLKTDPSTVQKRLKEGGSALRLDWLDSVTAFYQMSVSEMTTLPDSAWQEVKPLEAQMLAHFREMSELERRSLLTILSRPVYGTPEKTPRGLGRAVLTAKEQELVDLFARVKKDGVRDGVLRTLRGAAEAPDQPTPHTTE